jgi:hypothetical protein
MLYCTLLALQHEYITAMFVVQFVGGQLLESVSRCTTAIQHMSIGKYT